MYITDLADPPDRPRKTELQKLHEQMQRALQPLRQKDEMQELFKRCSPGYQLQELMRQFEPHRHIREMLERPAVSTHYQDLIAGSSIAVQAQRLLDQHFPKSTLTGLGLNNEALRRAARLAVDNDALRRAAGPNSVSEVAKHYERYLKPIWDHQDALGPVNAIVAPRR